MRSKFIIIAALAAWTLGSGACSGKADSVKFEPYDQGAVTMARTLGTPVVIYATADW